MTRLYALRSCTTVLTAAWALLVLGCPVDEDSPAGETGSTSDPGTTGETSTPTTTTPTTGISATGISATGSSSGDSSSTSPTGDPTSSTGDESSSGTTGGGCSDGELLCGGACVDPETSASYCGATDDCSGKNAGVVCLEGQECNAGSCSCATGILCGDTCIDPGTDSAFCGAADDCMGKNAGEACSPSAQCMDGGCVESCENCGFETGDFTGWTAIDLMEPYQPLIVTMGGQSFNLHTVTPTEGSYCVMNGFDGGGPGTIEVGQDITLAMEPPADLLFDYSAAWSFGGTLDRTFDVYIEPEGGGAPLEVVNVLTAVFGTDNDDTGNLLGQVDLSAYAGQTIFVRFVWDIPEYFTGPAQAQLDNVRIQAQ